MLAGGREKVERYQERQRQMIRSREIALKCSASLPPRLLTHRHIDGRRSDLATALDVPIRRLPSKLVEQLARCKDDEALRILLGRSR